MAKTPYFIDNCLKRFELQRSAKKGPLLKSLHHFSLETGKTRQKRSDRRAHIFSILEVMVPKIDLDTMAFGQFFTNHRGETDFYTRGVDTICAETGLQERTVVRCLGDLQKAGYLKVIRREAIGKCGTVMRQYSLRKFTNKFFLELGFQKKTIEDTKSWKRKQNSARFGAQKFTKTCQDGLAKLSELFSTAAKTIKTKAVAPQERKRPQTRSPEEEKRLVSRAYEIAQRLGTSPLDELRKLKA